MITCIFCGSAFTAKGTKHERSREHIFPRWLQRRYDIANEKISHTSIAFSGQQQRTQLSAFCNELVCKQCNTVTMKALEDKARPILLKLMTLRVNLNKINEDENLTLSLWALKTAYAIHTRNYQNLVVPQQHTSVIANLENVIPTGIHIFASQSLMTRYLPTGQQNRVLDFMQSTISEWPGECRKTMLLYNHMYGQQENWYQSNQIIKNNDLIENTENVNYVFGSYKITFRLKNLLLCIAYIPDNFAVVRHACNPDPGMGFTHPFEIRFIHKLLWPMVSPLYWCRGHPEFYFLDARRALQYFHDSVSIHKLN